MKWMRRALCTLLCGCVLFSQAAALPEMGALKSKAAALYAADGTELYAYHADEPLQPASVTKIMTMLLIMEAVDSGRASLDDMVTGSAHAASMGAAQIWLKEGEQLTLDEMLKAIAVGSANDCAVAVAEHLAGSEAAFVEQMNARAKELGCTGTTFVNANGLDTDGQKTLTTAHDLALISVELLRHPKIIDYTSIWMDTIRNGAFGLANTNKMLRKYDGMIGLKTGYISEAGFCISAAAERDGLTLIAVVMAAPDKDARTADASQLLNYGFANFAAYTPDVSAACGDLPVVLGKQPTVGVACDDPGTLTVQKEQAAGMTVAFDRPDSIEAPVTKGEQIGTARVLDADGKTVRELALRAAADVERLGFLDLFGALCRAAGGGA